MSGSDGAQTIYRGRLITLTLETARLPDGRAVELELVRHPGGAVIAAVDESDRVCLLRQHRHAAGGTIWELPAGCIDRTDATPADTARRELLEEAGLVAQHWTPLGSILPSPGFCDEVLHLFLARDLAPGVTDHQHDECIEVCWCDLSQALEMALNGEIRDAKTIATLLRTTQVVGRPGQA